MSETNAPTSATPRFQLPYLYPGQAQKEAFVNESLARIDMLLQPAILATQAVPPVEPAPGATYLVAAGASGAWAGRADHLAQWTGTQWLFVAPRPDLTVRDLGTGQWLRFDEAWLRLEAPAEPTGGAVVDAECRAALAGLIEALAAFGIFSR